MGSLKREKTAYGFVKKYLDEHNKHVKNNAEESAAWWRASQGSRGRRDSTRGTDGPSPKGYSIYQFCPVQHPANDTETDIITTHFDYQRLHGRLLRLDRLELDDPTMIRMLEGSDGVKATDIPLDDKKVMSYFYRRRRWKSRRRNQQPGGFLTGSRSMGRISSGRCW